MGTEREFKLTVDADWELPPVDGAIVAGPWVTREHVATYYDTADLRLARAGASLRFRDDDGWTVKLPAGEPGPGALVRAEHVFGGTPGAPPAEALEMVAARVRTGRLRPVVRLHTLRRTAALRLGGTAAPGDLGVLTDDVSTVLDGPHPATFREIEVELATDADDTAVDDLVAALRASGAGAPDPTPKVVRALGPAATEPSELRVHPVPGPPTVDAVIRHALSDAVAKLVASDPVARLGDDIEGVHQARVATRRLRSHLRTFGPLLDPEWTETLRAEIGWLADELGAVRDADVLRGRIEARVAALEEPDRIAAAPIVARIAADQTAVRAVLLDGLRSPRYLTLLDHLVEAAQRPRVVARVERDDAATLRELVRRPWKRLRKAVRDLPDDPPDAALHAVRIKAKRARYAAEVMEPAFGRRARAFAKALTRVQDVLGEHQDAVVAGRWLRATALTLPDPAAVYAAGELGAIERAAADASRAAWPAAWKAASRGRLRRWL